MTEPASSSSSAVAPAGAVPVSPPAAGVTQGDHTVPAPVEPALPTEAGARPRPQSFSSFLVLWFGQLISVIGSGLTGFALGVWVYQQTGSVTRFSLILLCTTLPGVILSPLAGALVDRWDRRWAMVLSDSVAGLMTLVIALLLYFDQLQLWMLYVAMVISSTFASLRWPAFSAATTLMVPKRHLSRAAGLSSMGQSASSLLAPILGGLLLVSFGIHTVLLIDVTTFVVAVTLALAVRVPRPEPVEGAAGQAVGQGKKGGGSLFAQAGHGWTYLKERPGLMGILFFSAFANLALGMIQVLAPPMVLAFASPSQLGTAMSTAGLGMLIGSLLMTVWKGPGRRIDGLLGFMAFCGLGIVAAALRPSLVQFAVAGFLFYFAFAISGACGQALWQLKVAPGFQGRVFAIRRLVGWSTFPIAFLCAGPLADRLFKPLLLPDGPLAGSVGRWVGVGPGRGVALLLVLAGLGLFAVSIASYASPRVRRVEVELPDVVSD